MVTLFLLIGAESLARAGQWVQLGRRLRTAASVAAALAGCGAAFNVAVAVALRMS